MKERFSSGFLTSYAGEPVVWQGDRFWWQDPPQAGGRFFAGHLVVALAHQSFGRPDFQGQRLYAFIVHNGKIVKEFSPSLMNRVPIKEMVGPLPFDDRKWEVGDRQDEDTRTATRYVLPGETVERWTERVTLQTTTRVAEDLTLDTMLMQSEVALGCAVVERNVLKSTPTAVLVEQTLAQCASAPDRHTIRKLIRGPRSANEVAYARIAPFSEADRAKWTALVDRTVWGSPCEDATS